MGGAKEKMSRDAFCLHCGRTVQLESEAEPTCPVCSSPLIEQANSFAGHHLELDELTERLLATLVVYSQDKEVDVDAAADRLIDLAEGRPAAVDQAHKRAIARFGNEPEDPFSERALDITRRAVEQAGTC